jgi:hypothetical protein
MLVLLGVSLAGTGLMTASWPVAGAGVVLTVTGSYVSWVGGVMNDATIGLSPRFELRAVRDGSSHPGVAAGAQIGDPAVREEAARLSLVTHQVLARAHATPSPAWTVPAGWTLLLVAAVLLVSQWELVAHTTTSRANSYRDTALAIVLGLSGLRLACTPGRHRVAAAAVALSGAGLVLNGLLADHDQLGLAVVETTAGAVAFLCAAATVLSTAVSRSRP